MSILRTEGWRASASSADNGGGLSQRAANMKGWSIGNPGSLPQVGGSGTHGWTVTGSPMTWTPRNPDGSLLVPGNRVILAARMVPSGQLAILDSAGIQNCHLVHNGTTGSTELDTPGGSLIASAAAGVTIYDSVSHYVEIDITIHDTAGAIVVRRDEVVIINASGLDTKVGLGNIGQFLWTGTTTLGDVVLIDPTDGVAPTAFIGDVTVETLQVNSDGAHGDFTPNSGGNRYSRVQEMRLPDGDTSYVSAAAVGSKDTYGHESLFNTTGTVYGVSVTAVARKTATGPRGIKAMVRSAGSDAQGTNESLLTQADYGHILGAGGDNSLAEGVFGLDPATGAAWSIAAANASEVGQVISS